MLEAVGGYATWPGHTSGATALMAGIAVVIKLESRGPVLFSQRRAGMHGRPFRIYKFRTMTQDGDRGEPLRSLHDPRVTRFGRYLRRTSLDELPQFLNVLKGEMSLVGPRPPIPYELEVYDIWHRRRVLEVKPGITGLWQVNGRSRLRFDDMVRLDLQYARAWSPWLDIKILLRTPRAVLSGEGAY